MNDVTAILNEREARDAKATLAEIDAALSSERTFEQIIAGLPVEVVEGYRRALDAQRADLLTVLSAYEAAKNGSYSELKKLAGSDPGVCLIVARIARGYSQKELARRLGLKEQQIQRYEAERYRSISITNYRRIAYVLDVRWEMHIADETTKWIGSGWDISKEISSDQIKKIAKHAKENKWFDDDEDSAFGEESHTYLQRYITDHILNYGSPTLLRTGLNVDDLSDDFLLVAWKSRVTRVAESIIAKAKPTYHGLDITWLRELVHLSILEDGPAKARDLLLSHGIILVAEPQITGLKLDGVAFLLGDTPVIGLTLRRDTLDNFWFTLLHEVAHVILHYRSGLRLGFFDDIECSGIDEIENEANEFASNILIPNEKWRRSPARIAKSSEVIEKFAHDMGIHPAIVFGRLQKERGNYAAFSNKVGRGMVRKWLFETT